MVGVLLRRPETFNDGDVTFRCDLVEESSDTCGHAISMNVIIKSLITTFTVFGEEWMDKTTEEFVFVTEKSKFSSGFFGNKPISVVHKSCSV